MHDKNDWVLSVESVLAGKGSFAVDAYKSFTDLMQCIYTL